MLKAFTFLFFLVSGSVCNALGEPEMSPQNKCNQYCQKYRTISEIPEIDCVYKKNLNSSCKKKDSRCIQNQKTQFKAIYGSIKSYIENQDLMMKNIKIYTKYIQNINIYTNINI